MNLNTVPHDDSGLFDNAEIAEILTPKRRNKPLRFAAVKKLVEALRPGRERQANLERYGLYWRLRFSLRNGDGMYSRKSIVIEDVLTAEWVREYLHHARSERRAFKQELTVREHRRRWLEAGVDPDTLLTRMPSSDQIR